VFAAAGAIITRNTRDCSNHSRPCRKCRYSGVAGAVPGLLSGSNAAGRPYCQLSWYRPSGSARP
jgi:hypothetical protein